MLTTMRKTRLQCLLCALLLSPFSSEAGSGAPEVVRLWKKEALSLDQPISPERNSQSRGPVGEISVINDVSVPTFTVFRPAKGQANGTGMLILPGGGFSGLAWDVEGTEVAKWMTDRGITAFLLKYRVHPFPVSPQEFAKMTVEDVLDKLKPAWRIAVADATQAMHLIRKDAQHYGINSNRIGMIGFSAGAATTMGVLLESPAKNQPNFAAPIYGMSMSDTPAVTQTAPPIFIAASQDDKTVPPTKSLEIFNLWTKANRPAELHIYTLGSHGFGMRAQGLPVDDWTTAFENWLKSNHWLPKNLASGSSS